MMQRGMEIKVTRFRGRCSCSAGRKKLRYWGFFGYPFPPIPCIHIPYIHSTCTCCTIHTYMYTCPTHMRTHIHFKSIIYCMQKYCILYHTEFIYHTLDLYALILIIYFIYLCYTIDIALVARDNNINQIPLPSKHQSTHVCL